jgi:hypothetical protein
LAPGFQLFSLSGGLVYHARALRYREGLWAPFRAALADWLARVLPPSEELVLVGPSAGHCLPLAQLAKFHRIVLLEPDPLARQLLAWRLGAAALIVESRDVLVEPLLSGKLGLDAVLELRPRASVLFCNLLGQVPLVLADADQQLFASEFRRRLLPRLSGRHWASFHDHWSLDYDARAEPVPIARDFECAPSDEELGVAWFGSSGAPVTALAHGAGALFPEAWPRRYFSWQLTPRALHVIEGVSGA